MTQFFGGGRGGQVDKLGNAPWMWMWGKNSKEGEATNKDDVNNWEHMERLNFEWEGLP